MKKDARRRKQTVPLPPYLYKWLLNYKKYTNCILSISSSLNLTGAVKPRTINNHFKSGFPTVSAEMRDPNKKKAYYLFKHLDYLFEADMIAYACANHALDIDIMPSIREFLRKCKITEKEFALETAYKRWQRSNEELPRIGKIVKNDGSSET